MVGLGEIWKPVMGWEDLYEVSNLGDVRRDGQTLSGVENSSGYFQVWLFRGGIRAPKLIHVLVCEAFFGQVPPGMQINHIDGDKKNNRLSNLEYCTPSQNTRHAAANGLMGKYSETQIREAVSLVIGGMTRKQAGAITGVSRYTIQRVISGRSRAHLNLSKPSLVRKSKGRLSEEVIKEISESNEGVKDLSVKFSISERRIYEIRYKAQTCSAT